MSQLWDVIYQLYISSTNFTTFTYQVHIHSSRHHTTRVLVQKRCAPNAIGAAWHVQPRRSIEMLRSSWWVDEADSAQFRRQSSTATWQILATATTDFLLNTRFAKYEVMKKTLKQMTEMKEMEKNGEESSRLQIVCVQLITLGNPKALHQTEP